MARVITYPPYKSARGGGAGAGASQTDDLTDKLLKYVPVEAISAYVTIYAIIKPDRAGALIVCGAGLLVDIAYLYIRSPKGSPPRWYYYALSAVAFCTWACGTSNIGVLVFGWADSSSQLVLAVGAILVPLADALITKLTS
jgi:hypothetical protein